MNAETVIAEYAPGRSGAVRLVLYRNRLVREEGGATEVAALAHIAAVRVVYDRSPVAAAWAWACLALAAMLALVTRPAQSGLASAIARLGEPARQESFDAALLNLFHGLQAAASLLPAAAIAIAALALLLGVVYWRGRTTFTVWYGPAERSCQVAGRDARLQDMAGAVAQRISAIHRGN